MSVIINLSTWLWVTTIRAGWCTGTTAGITLVWTATACTKPRLSTIHSVGWTRLGSCYKDIQFTFVINHKNMPRFFFKHISFRSFEAKFTEHCLQHTCLLNEDIIRRWCTYTKGESFKPFPLLSAPPTPPTEVLFSIPEIEQSDAHVAIL